MVGVESSSSHIRMVLEEEPKEPKAAFFELPSPVILTLPKHPPDHKDNDSHGTIHPPPLPPPPSLWDLPTSDMLCFYQRRVDLTTTSSSPTTTMTTTRRLWWPALYFASIGDAQYALLHLMADKNNNNNNNKQVQKEWMTATVQEVLTDQTVPVVALLLDQHQVHLQVVEQPPVVHDDPANLPPSNPPSHDDQNTNNTNSLLQSPSLFVTQFYAMQKATGPLVQDDPTLRAEWWGALQQVVLFMEGWKRHNSNNHHHHKSTTTRVPMAVNLPPRRVSTSPGTTAGMEGKATTTTTIGPRAALQVASTTAASSSLRHHQPSITKRAIPCPSFLVVSEPEDASATTTSLNEANTTTTLTTSRQDSNTDTTEVSHSSMAAERPHLPPRSEHPTPQEPPPCTTTTSTRRPLNNAQYQDVKRGLFATTAADAAATTLGTTGDEYNAAINTNTKATVLPQDYPTGTSTTNSHVGYHQPALEPRVSSNHVATRMHGVGRLDDGQSEAKTHTFNNNTTATTTTTTTNKMHTNDSNHKASSTSSSSTVATIGAAPAVVMDLNMDPNYVPSLDPPLSNPYCSWDEAWRILDFSGWTKRLQDVASSCSSRTMAYGVKEVYVKRGCCVSQSRPGVGYFTNVSDLQDFCRREYGWKGPLARPTRTAATHLKEGEDQDDEGVGHENEEEDDEEEEEEEDSRVRMEEGAEVPPRLSTESIISGLTMTTAGQSSFATGPARHCHPPTTNAQKDDDDDDDEQRSKSSSHTHHTFLTFFSEDKHRLDPYLRTSGWTIKPGKRLVDYYYLRPHCHGSLNANHQAGVDYFTSPEDVIAFLHQQQEQRDQLIAETTKKSKKRKKPTQEQGKEKGLKAKAKTKRSRKHESPKDRRDQSEKMKARKNSETTHGKSQASATTSTKSHGNSKTRRRSKVSVNQKNTKKNTNPRHLRVCEAMQLLRRIGILDATTNSNVQDPSDCGKEQWIIDLSGGEKSSDNLMEPHRFTFTGLRRFLCRFGVPDKYEHAMQTELSCSEMELLSQWIRFANVPLTASEIEVALRNSPCPFVSKQELPALLDANGIQTFDGNRYLKRTKGKHLGSKRDRDYFCCLATYEQFRAESRGDHWNVNYTKPLLTKQERQEQQQSRKFKDELRFLLWLATSPSPLPRFRKPLEEVVVQYADMPDLPCNQEEYDEDLVEKDSNSTTQELCEGDFGFSPEKDVDATTTALSLDEKDELLFPGNNNGDDGDPTQQSIAAPSTTKSFGSSSRSRKNTGLLSLSNKKPRVAKWYDTENRPEFDEVWPIFIKLGFQKHDQGFTHPAYNELVTIPTHQQLRLFVAFTGIPRQTKDAPNENTLLEANNVRERPGSRRSKKALTTNNSDDLLKELSEAESRKLMQFLIFARFPDQITTQVQAILDQLDGTVQRKEVEKFVRILGFHLVDGKYYPPGSDKHKQRFAALMNEKLMKPYQQIDSNKNGSAKRQSEFYHQQAKRVFGFHELDGLEMLKEYLRSTPCIRQTPLFDDNISIGTNEQMEEAEHFLTLWAIMKCSFEEWKKALPSFSIGSVRYHYALEHVIFGDKGEEL